jgi:hypothetical protein
VRGAPRCGATLSLSRRKASRRLLRDEITVILELLEVQLQVRRNLA